MFFQRSLKVGLELPPSFQSTCRDLSSSPQKVHVEHVPQAAFIHGIEVPWTAVLFSGAKLDDPEILLRIAQSYDVNFDHTFSPGHLETFHKLALPKSIVYPALNLRPSQKPRFTTRVAEPVEFWEVAPVLDETCVSIINAHSQAAASFFTLYHPRAIDNLSVTSIATAVFSHVLQNVDALEALNQDIAHQRYQHPLLQQVANTFYAASALLKGDLNPDEAMRLGSDGSVVVTRYNQR